MPTLDPKILSQLLTIQNFFLIMPTDQKLAEFFLSSLSKFPGIKNRYLCTEFTNGPTGGAFSHCRDCPVYLREEIDPSYHPCLVPPQNTMRIYSLDTIDRFYGYLLVEVQSKEQYDLYEPYVLNLCNTFILIHENRLQKEKIEASLDETQTHYRIVADNTYDWEYWINPAGKFIYSSKSCERTTGYDSQEFLADEHLLHKMIHPEDRHFFELHQEEISRQHYASSEVEFRIIRKEGTVIWIGHVCQPVYDNQGTFLGMRGNNRDITERKRLENELLQSQKMEFIGNLVGGIAHHINNLLMGIVGNLSLAEMETNESTKPYLVEAQQSSFSIGEIIKQLLAYSQESQVELRPTNLNSTIQTVLSTYRTKIELYIELDVTLCETLPLIYADANQLTAIITVLIQNACEAILAARNSGSPRNRYVISAQTEEIRHPTENPMVVLRVSDNGIGMNNEIQRKIFTPFFTTKLIGIGNVFGLAGVQNIVKQYGGHIEFESSLGEGTTFWVYFPAAQEPSRPARLSASEDQHRNEGTVLVIDDEVMLQEINRKFLKRLGYSTLVVSNGKEGLDVYTQNRDDITLVILDLSMPDMSGWEVLDEFHALAPTLPVIICSGYSPEGVERDKLRQKGASGFLTKPYSLDEMRSTINAIFGE
jgi:PAS domain S-box-containing protein